MKWLFDDSKSKAKKAEREKSIKTALESSEALEEAAKGTMNLAADVTSTLQAKIDEYANQIEQTSRLLSDVLLIVDTKGIIESINPAAEDMFGWRRRSILGKDISTIFLLPEDTVLNEDFMEKFVETTKEDGTSEIVHYEEFMGIRADGTKIFIDINASKVVNSSKKTSYIVLVRNMTNKVNNTRIIKELAERNQELLTTIDASHTGFVILENSTDEPKIKFANEGFRRFVGKPQEDLVGSNLRSILGLDKGYWTIRRSLNDQLEAHHEIQLADQNGKSIWFDIHITPVLKHGKAEQWILVFYNTSELKKAHQDLRKSEAHFRAFGEASSESMFVHDYVALLDWNERLLTLTGYNEEELEKIGPLDFVHPLERESIRILIADKNHESYETLFMTKEGEVREVAVNSRPISWENTEARIVVARDVTEFKDVETQLKKSRERYRTVIDNTIDMIVCFNKNLEITFTNQTFRDYYDVEIDDLIGFSLLEIVPETDHKKFKDYVLGITADNTVRRGIHRILRHNEIRWQDWIDRGIFNEDGDLIEIQSVARDITHLMPSQ